MFLRISAVFFINLFLIINAEDGHFINLPMLINTSDNNSIILNEGLLSNVIWQSKVFLPSLEPIVIAENSSQRLFPPINLQLAKFPINLFYNHVDENFTNFEEIQFLFGLMSRQELIVKWKVKDYIYRLCFNCEENYIEIITPLNNLTKLKIIQITQLKLFGLKITKESLQVYDPEGLFINLKFDNNIQTVNMRGEVQHIPAFTINSSLKKYEIDLENKNATCLNLIYFSNSDFNIYLAINIIFDKNQTSEHRIINSQIKGLNIYKLKSQKPISKVIVEPASEVNDFWLMNNSNHLLNCDEKKICKNCEMLRFPEANPSDDYLSNRIIKTLENCSYEVIDDFNITVSIYGHDEAERYAYVWNMEGQLNFINRTIKLSQPFKIEHGSFFHYYIGELSPQTRYNVKFSAVVLDSFFYKSQIFKFQTTNFSLRPLQVEYEWRTEGLFLKWKKPNVTLEPIKHYLVTVSVKNKTIFLRKTTIEKVIFHVGNDENVEIYKITVSLNDGLQTAVLIVYGKHVKAPELDGEIEILSCAIVICKIKIPEIKNLYLNDSEYFLFLRDLNSKQEYNYPPEFFKLIKDDPPTYKTVLINNHKLENNNSFMLIVGNEKLHLTKGVYEVILAVVNKFQFGNMSNTFKKRIDLRENSNESMLIIIISTIIILLIFIIACVTTFYLYRWKKQNSSVSNYQREMPNQNNKSNKVNKPNEAEEDHIYMELSDVTYSQTYEDNPKRNFERNHVAKREGSYILDANVIQPRQTYEIMKPSISYSNLHKEMYGMEQPVTANSPQNVYVDMTKNVVNEEDGYLKVIG